MDFFDITLSLVGPISVPRAIQFANEIETKIRGESRVDNQKNIFWLNSRGNNGYIYNFLNQKKNAVEKRIPHFFDKTGIPWLGFPSGANFTNILQSSIMI
jgi:hypothetical protein